MNDWKASKIQKRVRAAKVKTAKTPKAYSLKGLLFPIACMAVYSISGIAGSLSIYLF